MDIMPSNPLAVDQGASGVMSPCMRLSSTTWDKVPAKAPAITGIKAKDSGVVNHDRP